MDVESVSAGSDPSMETPLGDFDSGTSDVEADYEPIITAPGNDADDPLDTVIAGCVFPVDEFQQVSDGLNRHQNRDGILGSSPCLQAAIDITSTGDIAAEKRCAPEPTASGRGRAPRTHPGRVGASRLPPSRFLSPPPSATSPSIPHAVPAVPRARQLPRPHPEHAREMHHLRRPERLARPHPARHPPRWPGEAFTNYMNEVDVGAVIGRFNDDSAW